MPPPLQRSPSTFSTPKAIFAWLVTCAIVFYSVDSLATRPIPIRVEDYRMSGMTDEEVLSKAMQALYNHKPLVWWIHSPQPYLLFHPRHEYDIDEALYRAFQLQIQTDEHYNTVGIWDPSITTLQTKPPPTKKATQEEVPLSSPIDTLKGASMP